MAVGADGAAAAGAAAAVGRQQSPGLRISPEPSGCRRPRVGHGMVCARHARAMVIRLTGALLVAMSMLAGACGGSSSALPTATPTLSASETVSPSPPEATEPPEQATAVPAPTPRHVTFAPGETISAHGEAGIFFVDYEDGSCGRVGYACRGGAESSCGVRASHDDPIEARGDASQHDHDARPGRPSALDEGAR